MREQEMQPAHREEKRTFLFLQGPSSSLFTKCAAQLERMGHTCHRINLNMGDWIFWRRRGAVNYRGRGTGWPAFIRDFMIQNNITDLILLGEERPYHKAATQAAKALNVDIHVIEMGYLRPDWVTFERDGMSSNSRFPRNPQQIIEAAAGLPEPDWVVRFRQNFLREAGYDLLYNLPNVFLWFLYPYYRRHALFHPLAEYVGWSLRLLRQKHTHQAAQAICERLLAERRIFFIYPLQLQTDYQLRAHSSYADQQEAISQVLASFSTHASADHHLLVKLHPLDNGLIDWQSYVTSDAQRLGIGAQVHFIDGGDLDELIERAAGLVTINSTTAIAALRKHKPVKTLGAAIFDTPGLSYPGSLGEFWKNPFPADRNLTNAFFRLLAHKYHVRGNFYSTDGSSAAAEAIAERLHRMGSGHRYSGHLS